MDIKKFVTVTLVVIVILAVLLVPLALISSADDTEDLADSGRFKIVENYGRKAEITSGRLTYIFVDTETGVMYLAANGGTAGFAMTALLDADGTPLIWEGAK